jgi:hydroxypyruvate isomerase
MRRRDFLPAAAGVAAAATTTAAQQAAKTAKFKQGVTRGCFGKGMSLEDMCGHAARLGFKGFDLVGPQDFPTIKKHGLVPTMVPGGASIRDGINNKQLHDEIEKRMRPLIDAAAAAGAPNVIVMSGERMGRSDEEGIASSVAYLNRVKAQAEEKQITLCIELLNSKVNHKDYHCDRTWWGVEVCKRVNSPRVKLLYDIYHMQIMEGDVIRTIRENIQWFGHFHTAGNPGRHEMDDTQELNYRGIARAIADTGYSGWVVHEYSPVKDALKSLEETFRIFDV